MSDLSGVDLCGFPAALPPDGDLSHLEFDNPPSLAPAVITICAVMMSLAVVFTAGRFIANHRKLAWSDHFCLIALVCSLAQGGLMLAQLNYARHQWNIPACWFLGSRGASYAKILFSQQMFLMPGLFFSKASIFLLFGQLFVLEDKMQIAIRVGLVVDFLIHFTSIPVEAYFNAPAPGELWDNLMLSGKPERAIYWGIVQSVLSMILDLYIFIIPLPIIARLTLSPTKRIKVVAVFSTAFMAVVANIVSLAYRVLIFKDPVDQTWNLAALLICTVVELNVAIIVSSVPGFSKFVRLYIFEWAPVRSLRTKMYSNESSRVSGSNDSRNKPRTGRDDPARHRPGTNESWLLKTDATMEMVGVPRTAESAPRTADSAVTGGPAHTQPPDIPDIEQGWGSRPGEGRQ